MVLVDLETGGLPEGAERERVMTRSSEDDLERLARSMQNSLMNESFGSCVEYLSGFFPSNRVDARAMDQRLTDIL